MRTLRCFLVSIALLSSCLASTAAAQPAPRTINVIPLGGPAVQGAEAARPSCHAIEYPGNAGVISVQTTATSRGPRLAWGIKMYDPKESTGRWDVDTYLNGEKTTSGFHRTTTGPYLPHGSLQARSGQRFEVRGTLVSASGNEYHTVPNECFVP